MKRILYLLSIIFILQSCGSSDSSDTEKLSKEVDDIALRAEAEKRADDLISNAGKNSVMDKTGMADCPIKIISADLVKQSYSNDKNVKLTYQNISKKTIAAIRFEWYGENAFGEAADMGGIVKGTAKGESNDELKPGAEDKSTWDVGSRDCKKIVSARAYEVAFDDGTKWKAGNVD